MSVKQLTRRAWFGVLAAAGIAGVTKLRDADTPTPPYGVVDLDRWHALGLRQRGARVLLYGEDVTDRCFLFVDSPAESYAMLHKVNAEGRALLNDDRTGPAVERRHGRIQVMV
jgi:hypothetical protein